MSDSSWSPEAGSSGQQRDNNPFTESFSFEHFYTGAADAHHHSSPLRVRVPDNWPSVAAIIAASPKIPEYATVSDILRDGFAKAMKAAVEIIDDPNVTAQWTAQLAIVELEGKKAAEEAERRVVELWEERLRLDERWDEVEFGRDFMALRSRETVERMTRLADRYNIALPLD